MGNCFVNNKVVAQEEHLNQQPEKGDTATGPPEEKKKRVTFKLGEEARGERPSKRGVVRVRIVVTRNELKQIMLESCKKDSDPAKDFRRAMRSTARSILEVGNANGHEITGGGEWRPALEGIPEET